MTKEIDTKLADLTSQIEELKEQKRHFLSMSDVEKLAVELHSLLCTWNHEDGCSWYYEIRHGMHQWDDCSHHSYMKKAQALMEYARKVDMNIENILKVCEIMQGK